LKKTLLKGETPPFLIELPSYKVPDWRGVLLRVLDRAKAFVVRAGTIILAVAIVVWALGYFPHSKEIAQNYKIHREILETQADSAVANEYASFKERSEVENFERILKLAHQYDEVRDKALEKLGARADEEEPDENVKAVLNSHHDSMEALRTRSNPFVAAMWPKVVAVRTINENVKDKLEEMDRLERGDYLRQSYFGRMGKAIEPLFKPLGWDWRISMAAIASFPAREVVVATLGMTFNQGEEAKEESKGLHAALQQATWDDDPQRKLFNIPVALSLMIFFALCSQCAATLATIKRETNSWWWPVFSFTYMTVLAYLGALVTYQAGMRI
jgi:ferrous iron transport protein B